MQVIIITIITITVSTSDPTSASASETGDLYYYYHSCYHHYHCFYFCCCCCWNRWLLTLRQRQSEMGNVRPISTQEMTVSPQPQPPSPGFVSSAISKTTYNKNQKNRVWETRAGRATVMKRATSVSETNRRRKMVDRHKAGFQLISTER